MDLSISKLMRNIKNTVIVNFLLLSISVVLTIFIPNFLSVVEFGLWQLYKFYQTYLGYLHFGWTDGLFLHLGGEEYNKVDYKLYFSQFIVFVLMQISIAIIFFTVLYFTSTSLDKKFIVIAVSFMIVLLNSRTFLSYILLSTNRISEYNLISLIERGLFILFILSFYFLNISDYKLIILADVFCVAVSFMYSLYLCKEIVFQRIGNFYLCTKEIIQNISSGGKLLFANITSMLIIGVVRISIETEWGTTLFGRISLIISLVSIVMMFINSISNILFPTIRRITIEKIPVLYVPLRSIITALLFGVLILYIPFKELFSFVLPEYKDSIPYLVLVFPILVYESKMGLITNPILKRLRLEGKLFKLNIIALVLSIILAFISANVLKNLILTVSLILIILMVRSTLADIILSKEFNLTYFSNFLEESVLTIVFMISNWYFNNLTSFVAYLVIYILYLLRNKSSLKQNIIKVKSYI